MPILLQACNRALAMPYGNQKLGGNLTPHPCLPVSAAGNLTVSGKGKFSRFWAVLPQGNNPII
jgi:hypothetical protein